METPDIKTSVLPEIPLHIFKVGKKIAAYREKKQFSQKEMADKLNITERAYLNIEKDKNKTIDLYRIQEIAHILEVELWDLIEKQEDIKVQINNHHNKTKGHNNVNYFATPSEITLTHENEKLHQENSFLKEKISLLEDKIKDLEDKIELMKKVITFDQK